ncbi:MAG: YncE family protein [Athalassotoga sp.]|uniref:YncE family protein n=1 Tax=Athalassotoga sp. TaxID=2022597 RepID=UPI003D0183C8
MGRKIILGLYLLFVFSGLLETVFGNSLWRTINVGSYQNGIAVDSSNDMLYVAESGYSIVSVVDLKTYQIIKKINTGIFPYQIAINDKTDMVYVTNKGSNSIS